MADTFFPLPVILTQVRHLRFGDGVAMLLPELLSQYSNRNSLLLTFNAIRTQIAPIEEALQTDGRSLEVVELPDGEPELENRLFEEIREQVAAAIPPLQKLADLIGRLDCLTSLAQAAIKAANGMRNQVEKRSGHLSTGFFCTPSLLMMLSETGHGDTAYGLMNKREWPGYGNLIEEGHKVLIEGWRDIWEDPDGWKMGRLQMENAGAGEWFFRNLLGIQPDMEQPGFKRVLLKPIFPKGLKWARGSFRGPYGKIVSHWKYTNGEVLWDIVIPPNSRGRVELPKHVLLKNGGGQKPIELPAGRHQCHLIRKEESK